ncbi:MAG: hypothetical protein O2782_16635, partial [bacterium]|nr:hypothetical protein [bacterium]
MVGKPRWGWLVMILLLSSAALLMVFLAGAGQAILLRHCVWAAMAVCGLGGSSLILWWLLASGLSMGVRLGSAGAVVGALSILALGFELRGVTLDGVPLVQRRGSSEAGAELPQPHDDPWSNQRPPGERWPAQTTHLLQPRRHWRLDVGAGFAGFAVARGLAITQEQRGVYECVVAYDLRRGSEVWAYGDTARFADLRAGVGPRATPVIDGD